MDLPVQPPIEPMLAKAQVKVPDEAGVWSYEPKWDGFRAGLPGRRRRRAAVAQRQGTWPVFPELLDALRDELAPRCVLDGEIVVPREIGGRIRLDWESLSQRVHPAASRSKCWPNRPRHFIGFDALAAGDKSLMGEPFRVRREALSESVNEKQWCHVTRTTEDPEQGAQWLDVRGRGPRRRDRQEAGRAVSAGQAGHGQGQARPRRRLRGHRLPHPQEREGRVDPAGLYRDDGELQMVGGAASFTVKDRLKLLADLEPLRKGDDMVDGEPSRWNSAADKRWIPVRPEKVCEVLRPDGGKHRARPAIPARGALRALATRPRSKAAPSTNSTCR